MHEGVPHTRTAIIMTPYERAISDAKEAVEKFGVVRALAMKKGPFRQEAVRVAARTIAKEKTEKAVKDLAHPMYADL
jgi:hypothetical protein